MKTIETLANNLNEKIIKEIKETQQTKTLLLYEFALEFQKFQSYLFPSDNKPNTILNFNIVQTHQEHQQEQQQHQHQQQQPLINFININATPIKQKSNENTNQKENHFLNKKRFYTETNTQIEFAKKQAIKNKKVVFCHSDQIINNNFKKDKYKQQQQQDNYSNLNTMSNKSNQSDDSSLNSPAQKSRGSIYRGVSRNGNQWQVLIMINKKKLYIGSYSTEVQAAKAYDVVALRNHGKRAKTNFYYTTQEIEKII